MALVLESQGNDKSSFAYCNKKMSQSRHGRRKDFADELMRDQFIAGLTSDALRVKLIGKGHRHKTTQEKVKLREVAEVAKAFEATTFANQLMKAARNTQQEQINYTTKSPPPSQCFWCGGKHQQPRQQHCPAMGKKCAKCGITGHFARVCRGGTPRQARLQQSNFVSEDTNEEAFVTECDTTPQFARKYFANLHLIYGEKTKVVKAQIDSASTCNTIPSSLTTH